MDNAPCHKSRKSMKAFDDNEIQVHNHPAVSPDLNPCENIFAHLKNEICKARERVHNAGDVFTVARRTFFDTRCQEIIENCFDSMKRRWTAVVKANGGPTKY